MSLSALEFDRLATARDALLAAPHGEKGAVVAATAKALGCSVQTLYRKLEQAGLDTGRQRRADAGRSSVSAAHLERVAGVVMTSANKKGQHMPLNLAVEILKTQGQMADVSAATVSRQLHRYRMSAQHMAAPAASVQLRSLHPNHVWQVDSTTGAYYYLPGGKLRWMPEDEFYKNKVANLVKASTDLLTRYCAADHTSHAFKARYYLGGETAANLLDFMCWAMWKQASGPMHGVPFILMMDPGAANKGLVMRNFCRRLGIELRHHAAGAARVTGSVEKAHDLARMHFETRLRFVDPGSVTLDMLNHEIEQWAATYCTTASHTRHHRSRYGAWMTITAEQLRVAATEEALREAAHKEPESHRVSNDRTITFGKPSRTYRLDMVPGATPAMKVMVVQNVFRAPAIDVLHVDPETGTETWHLVQPIEIDDWGFDVTAPVIGQHMRTARNTDADELRNAFTKQAYQRPGGELPTLEEAAKARRNHAQAYEGTFDVMADVKATEVPAYLPRRSTPIEGAVPRDLVVLLSTAEACQRIRERIGEDYARASKEIWRWVEARFAGAVPEDQLDQICVQFAPLNQQGVTDQDTGLMTGLRAAGGEK